MSILIEGIDMPTAEQGVRTINIYADGVVTNYAEVTIGRAVTVPLHGDLIDRDAQIERAWRLKLSTRELIEEMLKSAPIIIPASCEAAGG